MLKNFLDASLRPPADGNRPLDEHGGASQSWAMIDFKAYIADCRNVTTAYGRLSNYVEIQVTFCAAPPPALSYFCVWCPEPSHLAEIALEPNIIAAETDLVVLSIGLMSKHPFEPMNSDILVHKAGREGKRPSLDRVVCYRHEEELLNSVGILRHRNNSNPNDDDSYYIFGLTRTVIPWQFKLHLYDPKTEYWSHRCISVDRRHQHGQFRHSTSKVIMLGEGNLMGFVDPWRGILVCDVLAGTHFYYIPFPRSLRRNKRLYLEPVIARDVVAVQGRIKVAERFRGSVSGVWKASVWSRPAYSSDEDWNRDYNIAIPDVLVDGNTLHLDLLPKMNDGTSRRTLEGLHITHPTLSLDNDDIVYFMTKVHPWDKKAWVLAINMKNQKLLDVGVFRAERYDCITLYYISSRISKYFRTSPGMKLELKRGGEFFIGYPRKKQTGIFVGHEEGTSGAEVADSMDLSEHVEPASEHEVSDCMQVD